ncbi:endonuclease/exonuclease/phosphatase family protein [Cyclobacterium qasimii]|uniref:Metallophosphoesterase n=1 Tax=Cyclobacterium qasimii TaxID=1350429 RepID=A0A512CAB1_9BACT|nr:endonuclease/exonuclease/phosphatase family protein [Cyclobacterium qasimii]GEO21146.1 metallophosphoesterase [Cyclobacterium qasimii]
MNYKILLFAFCLLLVKEQALHAQSLKVISYNIHHGADKNEVNTLEEMGAYIKRSQADLVGLQEVDSMCNRSGNVDQMKVLAEITGMHYVFLRHFAYDGGAYGLGILSKYPINSQQNGKITSMKNGEKKSLGLLGARISLPNGQQLDFATVHYALDQSTRMIQAAETLDFFKKDVPVVLTGDFNALPGTDEMKLLSQQFKMADENLGFTFPTINPVKKIDFIWTSKKNLEKANRVHIPSIHWSDHLPLEAHLVLNFN